MLKVIEYEHVQADSGFGTSYYKKWCQCPKAARIYYDNKEKETEEERIKRIQEGLEYDNGRVVGAMGHILFEHHFNNALPRDRSKIKECFKWKHQINSEAWTEALRCFRAWSVHVGHRTDIFGYPKYVERDMPYPKTSEEHLEKIYTACGVEPFTARYDLQSQMTSQTMETLFEVYGEDIQGQRELIQPGVWIVDHKFLAREYSFGKKAPPPGCSHKSAMAWIYENDLQMQAYQILYNQSHKEPCKGVLVNAIFKTKSPKFRIYVVPPVNEEQTKRVQAMTEYAVYQQEHMSKQANPTECVNYMGYTCPYYKKECGGY